MRFYRDLVVAEDSCGLCLIDVWSTPEGQWADDAGYVTCPDGELHQPND